jgi:hypothetical protein
MRISPRLRRPLSRRNRRGATVSPSLHGIQESVCYSYLTSKCLVLCSLVASCSLLFVCRYLQRFGDCDPLEFWLEFLKHSTTRRIQVQEFLYYYVKTSLKTVSTFYGRKEVQSVRKAASLNTQWKALVAAVDQEILRPYRMEDVDNNMWAVLKRPKDINGSLDDGPASDLTQVSTTDNPFTGPKADHV